MLIQFKRSILSAVIFAMLLPVWSYAAGDADSVILYTPYTKITVTPGQIVDYSIDLINNSKRVIDPEIQITGIPAGWQHSLKANNYDIRQLSVLPGERRSCNLSMIIPLRINKGSYKFRVSAGTLASLPLTVVVAEQGLSITEFTTTQANMQGPTSSTFTFETVLKNFTGDKQNFALIADAPRGWNVSFSVDYKKVTAVEITSNNTTKISIEVDPPDMAEAKSYKIPVRAVTNASSAALELEAVITGTYSLQLSTPTGLLSSGITAGDQKKLQLEIKNTGTVELFDVQLTQETPINWEVTFDPQTIKALPPGNAATAYATIKASKKAVAGDYVLNIEAKAPEASSKASFRFSVRTPMLTGWLGILIIVAAAGSVYLLFRKYGRR